MRATHWHKNCSRKAGGPIALGEIKEDLYREVVTLSATPCQGLSFVVIVFAPFRKLHLAHKACPFRVMV